MEQKKIDRINELARKQKTIGLTEEEKQEQYILRNVVQSFANKNYFNIYK